MANSVNTSMLSNRAKSPTLPTGKTSTDGKSTGELAINPIPFSASCAPAKSTGATRNVALGFGFQGVRIAAAIRRIDRPDFGASA